jgi:chemotaxis protein CheZ
MTAENDSADLEALFDSLAVAPPHAIKEAPAATVKAAPAAAAPPPAAAAPAPASPPPAAPAPAPAANGAAASGAVASGDFAFPAQENIFKRLGKMARQLHTTLHELGYDKLLKETVESLPDARDRLAYIANLTEQAACRVLNATDVAQPAMTGLEDAAKALGARWDKVFSNQITTDEFKQLSEDTRTYLNSGLPAKTEIVNAQLMEIMMAQDFQDLTGQVIKKIVAVSQELENDLMAALLEVIPQNKRSEELDNLMNGPVINAEGRTDVVANQQQVDDLLDSLGF